MVDTQILYPAADVAVDSLEGPCPPWCHKSDCAPDPELDKHRWHDRDLADVAFGGPDEPGMLVALEALTYPAGDGQPMQSAPSVRIDCDQVASVPMEAVPALIEALQRALILTGNVK